MKPIMTLTILSRDPMDPETLTKVGVIGFECVGEGQVILTRDEMGAIKMEAADIKPDDRFLEALENATKAMTHLHETLGEAHMDTAAAMAGMFEVHKWLTR